MLESALVNAVAVVAIGDGGLAGDAFAQAGGGFDGIVGGVEYLRELAELVVDAMQLAFDRAHRVLDLLDATVAGYAEALRAAAAAGDGRSKGIDCTCTCHLRACQLIEWLRAATVPRSSSLLGFRFAPSQPTALISID